MWIWEREDWKKNSCPLIFLTKLDGRIFMLSYITGTCIYKEKIPRHMLYYTTFEVLTAGEHVLHGHGRRCWDVLAILLFIDISSTIWKKDLITRHVYMYMYILGIRQGRDETNHIDVA